MYARMERDDRQRAVQIHRYNMVAAYQLAAQLDILGEEYRMIQQRLRKENGRIHAEAQRSIFHTTGYSSEAQPFFEHPCMIYEVVATPSGSFELNVRNRQRPKSSATGWRQRPGTYGASGEGRTPVKSGEICRPHTVPARKKRRVSIVLPVKKAPSSSMVDPLPMAPIAEEVREMKVELMRRKKSLEIPQTDNRTYGIPFRSRSARLPANRKTATLCREASTVIHAYHKPKPSYTMRQSLVGLTEAEKQRLRSRAMSAAPRSRRLQDEEEEEEEESRATRAQLLNEVLADNPFPLKSIVEDEKRYYQRVLAPKVSNLSHRLLSLRMDDN